MSYGLYCRLNVHVLDSNRTVIRALRKKFSPKARTRRYRTQRHSMIREVLRIHRKEAELYLDVMEGNLNS